MTSQDQPSTTDPDRIASGFVPSVSSSRYVPDARSHQGYEKNGIVSRLVPRGARVLDVGCGSGGTLATLIKDLGCEGAGIELNSSRAEMARSHGLEVFETPVAGVDPDAIGTFDVVLYLDVLEHLADPCEELVSVRKFTRRDGRLVVSVPNVAHWSVRWNLLRGRFDYAEAEIMDATHLRWFTRRTLEALLRSAGFQPETYAVSSGTWLSTYRSARPFRWMPERMRNSIVRRAARFFPGLFGCQHIVSATIDPAWTQNAANSQR